MPRSAQEQPRDVQKHLRNDPSEFFRKIGNLSSRVRLVSPEGRKIAQIGSLARWKRLFPAFLEGEGCPITCPVPEPRCCVTCASFLVDASGLILVDFWSPEAVRVSQECPGSSGLKVRGSGLTVEAQG